MSAIKPLTDAQLAKIAVEDEFLLYCSQDEFKEIARAIEQAHGITAAPKPDTEAPQFCYCNDDISLQMVSGGAAQEGLYGRITLMVDKQYVDYVKSPKQDTEAALQKIADFGQLQALTDDLIESVIRDVAELDYSSPEGMPDVMLVTADELRGILQARLCEALAAPPAAPAPAAPVVPPGMTIVSIDELSRLRKHANFNVVELAYEQRESPGPFVGLAGTTNVMFANDADGGITGGGNG